MSKESQRRIPLTDNVIAVRLKVVLSALNGDEEGVEVIVKNHHPIKVASCDELVARAVRRVKRICGDEP